MADGADVQAAASDAETSGSEEAPSGESSFVDGVLTTSDVTIKITEVRTIPVGDVGNEYGDKPVIAFWYEITNLIDKEIDPMEWIYVFSAYQDNDPNRVNELDVGALPDDRFLETQMETIKKGGTVENAVAYELDDETTPVELVATESLLGEEIGRATYEVS